MEMNLKNSTFNVHFDTFTTGMSTSADHLLCETFRYALKDYLLLLEKGYPQKLVLKMVGDRYSLTGIQRVMLYRGVTIRMNNYGRGYKLTTEDMIADQVIHVDALNVLITVASYLSGQVVFVSTDKLLRDASGVHGKIIKDQLLHRALELSLSYLSYQKPGEVRFYVDRQVNQAGWIQDTISRQLEQKEADCSSVLCENVDALLSAVTAGIIATSDSDIIDRARVPVFDLPYHILKNSYHPDFIDLRLLSS